MRPLLSLSSQELSAFVASHGGREFHARILRRDLLERGILDYEEMTGLSARLRAALIEHHPLLSAREVGRKVSRDGTTKLLLAFPDPAALTGEVQDGAERPSRVETVHIPPQRKGPGRHATLCVSTQVGCPVGCPFCASGLLGLTRNLEAHEIVEQFLLGRSVGPVSRAVVMGVGEPLLNTRALTAALEVVLDEMGIGARKITVSTVGFPDRLRRAAREKPRFQLAISLHTPDDEQRDRLVPAMAGTPIDEVLAAGDDWFEQTGREVTYEYVLLAAENDSAEHARRLAERLHGRRATVNLIPYNPVGEAPYRRPAPAAVTTFHETLRERGVVATVRWSRGTETDAACGQLRISHAGG